jgi:sulfopyruvate decarboxylase alpha subunit|tara:strand:- start:105 stop:623 length:519 start_codon:yes stop_codon:yes gene_type:complete
MSDLEKSWQDQLYDTLRKENISIFSYVPDAGHKVLIDRAIKDNSVTAISLTSEQEGIGIAVGSYLGGSKAVLLMQSSGVGNCINQLSLIKHGQFPFLTIVTMRGEYGEGNPWQFAMGEAVVPTLSSMGVKCLKITTEDEIESTIKAALIMVFQAERSVAVLLSQKLLGAKVF